MYQEIAPKNWASQYIETYWIESNISKTTSSFSVFPDGCTDIIISYRNNTFNSFFIGCMTQPIKVNIEPGELMCGIRFHPGCSSAFLKTSMKELTNKKYSLIEIINIDFSFISSKIILNETDKIPELFEKHLKMIFSENHFKRHSFQGARLIKQQNGTSPIEEIANQLNLSRRSFERVFNDSVGINPKLFSRIIRFLYVKHLIEKNPFMSLVDLALTAGYFDQAHFCKEFKEFTGLTPLMIKSMSHFYNTPNLK